MLSFDTPEKEDFAGSARDVIRSLGTGSFLTGCGRLLSLAVPVAMREYLLATLGPREAAARQLRAGRGASTRFKILLAETTKPSRRRKATCSRHAWRRSDRHLWSITCLFCTVLKTRRMTLFPTWGPRRHTLNLNMISEGWRRSFQSIPPLANASISTLLSPALRLHGPGGEARGCRRGNICSWAMNSACSLNWKSPECGCWLGRIFAALRRYADRQAARSIRLVAGATTLSALDLEGKSGESD